tara:strand:- start:7207 stop:7830 length:624 start_codon:yes stop_codon:yes gene_type:complete
MESPIEENLTITEEYIEENASIDEDTETLDKVVQKPKKPRTQKQLDALAKARQTRKDNIRKRKEQSLNQPEPSSMTELPEASLEYLRDMALAVPNKKKPRKKKVIFQQAESSSEEEIIYMKAPKKKKKKKKIVYQQPEYTSSSSSDEEIIEKVIQKPKRVYRKKVSLKVSDSEDEEEAYVYENAYEDYQYQQTPQQPLKYSDVFRFH